MEKNYYITKFSSQTDYNTFKASTAFTKPNVSLIATNDSYDIEFSPIIIPVTNGICIHKDGKFKIVKASDFDAHYDDILASGYTIEGISVVPDTHTPDGTTRIMSLRFMSTGSPETGKVDRDIIYYGGYGEDLSGLTNFDYLSCYLYNGQSEITGNTFVYLPSDYSGFTGAQSVVDSKAKYAANAENYYRGPSPYMNDNFFKDAQNPLYGIETVTSPQGTRPNGFSDMDGSGNTEIIVANATAQTDWRTASTITNGFNAGYYPAACCCKRYSTSGLPAGSWYLPALGEVGYVVARVGSIDSIFTLINSKNSSLCPNKLLDSYRIISSTEISSNQAWGCEIYSGRVVKIGKNNGYTYNILAFASVYADILKF